MISLLSAPFHHFSNPWPGLFPLLFRFGLQCAFIVCFMDTRLVHFVPYIPNCVGDGNKAFIREHVGYIFFTSSLPHSYSYVVQRIKYFSDNTLTRFSHFGSEFKKREEKNIHIIIILVFVLSVPTQKRTAIFI